MFSTFTQPFSNCIYSDTFKKTFVFFFSKKKNMFFAKKKKKTWLKKKVFFFKCSFKRDYKLTIA